jgi:hypothetical protein
VRNIQYYVLCTKNRIVYCFLEQVQVDISVDSGNI